MHFTPIHTPIQTIQTIQTDAGAAVKKTVDPIAFIGKPLGFKLSIPVGKLVR